MGPCDGAGGGEHEKDKRGGEGRRRTHSTAWMEHEVAAPVLLDRHTEGGKKIRRIIKKKKKKSSNSSSLRRNIDLANVLILAAAECN